MYFDLKKVKYLKTCLHIAQHTAECSNCRYERIYVTKGRTNSSSYSL